MCSSELVYEAQVFPPSWWTCSEFFLRKKNSGLKRVGIRPLMCWLLYSSFNPLTLTRRSLRSRIAKPSLDSQRRDRNALCKCGYDWLAFAASGGKRWGRREVQRGARIAHKPRLKPLQIVANQSQAGTRMTLSATLMIWFLKNPTPPVQWTQWASYSSSTRSFSRIPKYDALDVYWNCQITSQTTGAHNCLCPRTLGWGCRQHCFLDGNGNYINFYTS